MTASRARLARTAAAGCLLLCAYALVHLSQVHSRSSEYRWFPTATAPRIQLDGRSYLRAGSTGPGPSAGEVLLGRSEGGGRIYGPPSGATLPTVVRVVARGHAFTYELSGGP